MKIINVIVYPHEVIEGIGWGVGNEFYGYIILSRSSANMSGSIEASPAPKLQNNYYQNGTLNSVTSTGEISFPIPYASVPHFVMASPASVSSNFDELHIVSVFDITSTSFKYKISGFVGGDFMPNAITFNWVVSGLI